MILTMLAVGLLAGTMGAILGIGGGHDCYPYYHNAFRS